MVAMIRARRLPEQRVISRGRRATWSARLRNSKKDEHVGQFPFGAECAARGFRAGALLDGAQELIFPRHRPRCSEHRGSHISCELDESSSNCGEHIGSAFLEILVGWNGRVGIQSPFRTHH